jgi:rhamnosyltransferase
MRNGVCAVVVTYHPDRDLERNIAALRPQVEDLLLVDNASGAQERDVLRTLVERYALHLIENAENYGIGVALNQGVDWADRKQRYEFLLFFDQDSRVGNGFVEQMIACYRKLSAQKRVFVVGPRIVDQHTGAEDRPRCVAGEYVAAQTSGSLMPLRSFSQGMRFREDLFIDYVDYEFCLRLISRGWKIAYCDTAVLYHMAGNPKRRKVLGKFQVTTLNYGPVREYYLMRNGLWMVRNYGSHFPRWSIQVIYGMVKGVLRILLLESERTLKVKMWALAIRDAVLCRLGPYPHAQARDSVMAASRPGE